MNANTIHGSSVVKLRPLEDWHIAAFSDSTINDRLFEVVYVANEIFEDGYSSVNVCWRMSDKSADEKLKKTKTFKTRIIWGT